MSRWVSITTALYETEVRHCDFCGKMMVGRYWSCEVDGTPLSLCDQECERWWRTYWLPRYSARVAPEPTRAGWTGTGRHGKGRPHP